MLKISKSGFPLDQTVTVFFSPVLQHKVYSNTRYFSDQNQQQSTLSHMPSPDINFLYKYNLSCLLKCVSILITHQTIHNLQLRFGSVHWGCEVVVSWWGLCLLEVSQWHCRCCCLHHRGLCSWCEFCLPCSLTDRMSASDLCNVHVHSFDWIFSDVDIGYSKLVAILILSVPSFHCAL